MGSNSMTVGDLLSVNPGVSPPTWTMQLHIVMWALMTGAVVKEKFFKSHYVAVNSFKNKLDRMCSRWF